MWALAIVHAMFFVGCVYASCGVRVQTMHCLRRATSAARLHFAMQDLMRFYNTPQEFLAYIKSSWVTVVEYC